jgi:hypothetical protein
MNENGTLLREGFFRKNNKENGKFHSNWLSMMMPRLYLARNLLRNDGIIFISIDDNEQANLKLLLDEIFGTEAFIGTIPRLTKKSGKSSESLAKNHDYILIYGKGENSILKGLSHNDEGFSNEDKYKEERGLFKLNQTLDYNTLGYVKSLDYEIIINGKSYYAGNVTKDEWERRRNANPKDGYRWRWSKELFEFGLQNDFIVVKDTGRLYTKTYLNCSIKSDNGSYKIVYDERKKSISSIDFLKNEYSNDNSRKNIVSIFGEAIFEYSKPVELISKLVEISTGENDIILDFFAGSGTTAQAILQLNQKDFLNRKFICIQLPEKTEENSLAFQRGYKFISQITLDRIKKSIKKYFSNDGSELFAKKSVGFRYFIQGPSNFKIWRSDLIKTEADLKSQLQLFDRMEKNSAPELNILWELVIKTGLPLTERIVTIKDNDLIIYHTNDLKYAFLLHKISENALNLILRLSPTNVLALDSLFEKQDSLKTNFILSLEQNNIHFKSI